MKSLQKVILLAFVLLCTQFSKAQKQVISGTITDSKGVPLQGVVIKNINNKRTVLTDEKGNFNIEATLHDVLAVSSVGYAPKNITVTGTQSISVSLEESTATLEEIVLVGSRHGGRIQTETPVPVDVFNMNQVTMPTAKMDVTSILNYAAPSFNYNKQSGSDGADHIDLATLRGLGPDQTLVLINGKRRHQTAFVAVFGTRGRGNSGTDLNAIPQGAIDRIEILRDGASAQYGSDAIAGVINIILKKDVNHFSANAGWSGYYDKKYNTYFGRHLSQYEYSNPIDGNAFNFNANYGLQLGKNGGFINLTGSFITNGKTFRQVLDTSHLETNPDAAIINTVRRAYGDGSLTAGGGFLNSELPINQQAVLYLFGGYNYKASDAFAFSRNFSARPDRFPTDNNGNLIFVDGIMHQTPDGETYYNPHIQTHIGDAAGTVGVRGTMSNDWTWDFSNTLGQNKFHFYGDKTFNASLGPSPTHFDDGGFSFLQNTTNLNFNKEIKGIAAGFNLAFGAEFRYEKYKIFAGEETSYKNYNPNKASGAQGFPGYQPADEVNTDRNNIGGYIDAEIDITNRWLVGGAIRLENYSDFGFTSNYKIDFRYKAASNFNIRGSFSTGFRAPSLQQINFSSTFTTVQGSNVAEVKIAPNYSPITKAAGIPSLKEEKSINASLGFTWKPIKDFTATVDGYYVHIKDRVVLSGQFDASDPTLDPELTTTLQELHVGLAQFFANAVNTTNYGVDIVLDYNKKWKKNNLRILLAGNIQDMNLDDINVPEKLNDNEAHRKTFLSDREQKFILASAPPVKFSLGIDYNYARFGIGTHFTYFGKIDLYGYGEDGLGINPMVPTDADPNVYVPDRYIYHGKVVSDAFLSYKLSKWVHLFIGADNIFNVHPDYSFLQNAKQWAYNNEPGGAWEAVQMGSNGRRFFARLAFDF